MAKTDEKTAAPKRKRERKTRSAEAYAATGAKAFERAAFEVFKNGKVDDMAALIDAISSTRGMLDLIETRLSA